MKKFSLFHPRFIVLPIAILGIILASAASTLAADPFKEVNGRLVIEAENYHSKANTGVRNWYVFPRSSSSPTPDPDGPHTSGAGNGKYVEALPDTRVTHSDPLQQNVNFFKSGSNAPRMNYRVRINSAGRYYIRGRSIWTGTEDNGVHFGYDNKWPLSGTAAQWCGDWHKWQWSGNRRTASNHCGIKNALYLDLSAGDHTIMIAMREDGFELDRFVLTKSSTYFPTGVGPAESPRTTGGSTPPPPPPPSPPTGVLDSRFAKTTLTDGVEYYTDRDYQLTGVPSSYDDMVAIITPNADRNRTDASGYLTFTMPYDGTVYVAYDSRATSEPNWMNGFLDTGDILETSLSTQPSLKIYSQNYDKGDIINFGANKAPGFTGGTVSNYIVFYSHGDCALDSKFDKTTMAVAAYYYTDRNYTITDGVPDWMLGRTLIQTPNNEKKNSAASGYVRFTTPVSWWVYVLFDSRSSSIPSWLNGWELRSQYEIETSLETQPYMKVYRKWFNAGQCVDLGGNYGPGASSEYRSNYMVVYGK
ncbi:MAG: hypothetical protein HGJ94_01890 [Desulfosarcina sp.]|nr:hypothetical protein [Desulfosarcina sp.]